MALARQARRPSAPILGHSSSIQKVLKLVERIAPSDENVLIHGESGTGKELIANELHDRSRRCRGPFVAINCAAIQETLLESELFGHEKGAYTSADAPKPGLFEMAAGGTLFIDEIGEMSPQLQAKLLRVVEERMILRVGGSRWLSTNVRGVTATNNDLVQKVRARLFRQDLYYRLNVLTIHVPPLRERAEDIPPLVAYFLALDPEAPQEITVDALRLLMRHHWPGNIRELRNVVRRGQLLCSGTKLTARDFPAEVFSGPAEPNSADGPYTLAAMERLHIDAALRAVDGHKSRAAARLGISRHRLYRLIAKHGL